MKKTVLSALTICLISSNLSNAQTIFNEVNYSPKQTVFILNSPTSNEPDAITGASNINKQENKKKVVVKLYDNGLDGKALKTIKMKPIANNRWQAIAKGDLKGLFYTFDAQNGETPGVFAKAVGVNGKRGAIIDLKTTNPIGWENDKMPFISNWADLIVYELHHRDFSISHNSGIKNKGKFLALTEPKAINYLKELGVNAIHILPSFDFATIDETQLNTPQYNWGYDPLNYNVPEGSYSTNPYDPAVRIKEFKEMVKALHNAGIKVILDVVYNHTNNIEGGNFQRTYPNYYYRKTPDGKYSDGSGCGNETASEKALMRNFMLESVLYWINEYHIDGFRFDLMGIHDIETMNIIRSEVNKVNPNIFIYGEGWTAGKCAYPEEKLALKAHIKKLNGIAAFSDEMRDALRGPFSNDHLSGFLGGENNLEESIKFGIVGAINHKDINYSKVNYSKEAWANEPTQMISYVSCHDDMCLTDRLRSSISNITREELIKLDMLAQTAVLTSQGVPFILSGEEMLRDKKGVHNSYNSPDSINQLNWQNLEKYPQVFDYYKNLIAMRKEHKVFRLGSATLVNDCLSFLPSPPLMVAYSIEGHKVGDNWKKVFVFLNSSKEIKTMQVPQNTYSVVCKDGTINLDGIETITTNSVNVNPQSALIIYSK